MKKYIKEQLQNAQQLSEIDRLHLFNNIYIVLEAKDHKPQAIKRAIEEIINKHFRELL